MFPVVKKGDLSSKKALRDPLSTRRMGFKVRSGAASAAATNTKASNSGQSKKDKGKNKVKSLVHHRHHKGKIKKSRKGANDCKSKGVDVNVRRHQFLRICLQVPEKKKKNMVLTQGQEKNILHSWIRRPYTHLMDQWMKLKLGLL